MTEEIAAVWSRVSTEGKQEPSLDSQVVDVKSWLESQGWRVPPERIITVHWTSKNILACPDMQRLLSWVKSGEVKAVGLLHLDRFACRMGQMGQILDAFREGGVQLLAKNSPLQSGLLGEAMAMVITIAKAFQVERADEGSKDGLRKRATLRGLPTTCQAPYGYRWDETRTRLLTTTDWEHRKLIIRQFLEGATIHAIRKELHSRIIPSPKGLEWWPEPTIWGILVDSVNCGEYRALRREAVDPKVRRGKPDGEPTYGKTSSKKLPGVLLPNIKVENPVVMREEQDWILARMERNRLKSRRNAKHDFLLRGMIRYEPDGRCYSGSYMKKVWAYKYPDDGPNRDHNPKPYINGKKLDQAVETKAREILNSEVVLGAELGRKEEAVRESITNIQNELRSLERRINANTNAETQLLLDKDRFKDISDEAFERALTRLHTERTHVIKRQQEMSQQLQGLQSRASSIVGLKQLRAKLEKKLDSQEFADRLQVLEALGTGVNVTEDGRLEIDFTLPGDIPQESIALSVSPNAYLRYSIVLFHTPFNSLGKG